MGNTTQRVIVALIAIPLIIAACYLGNEFFLLFTLGVGVLSFMEFSNMAKQKGSYSNLYAGLISVAALISNSFYNFIDFQILVISLIFILF